MAKIVRRNPDNYACGKELRPLKSFKVRKKSIDDILKAMRNSSLSARETAKGVDILEKAIKDPDCKVVLTLSGIVTVSKMGGLICEMIDDGWIDCVVATGALIAHGAVEGCGGGHFEHNPNVPDSELYELGYDRIYDTLELESNLDNLEVELEKVLALLLKKGKPFGSRDFCTETGKLLNKKYPKFDSILKSAYLKKVPIFIPAFTDSELALESMSWFLRKQLKKGQSFNEALKGIENFNFNPFKDLAAYFDVIRKAKKLAIFTLGGGVPRNYAQQVAPLIEIFLNRFKEFGVAKDMTMKKFQYGVRVCPEPTTLGGLSGCTYSEGVSWGKFSTPEEKGEFAEIYSDYTAILPWMVKGLQERLSKR